MTLPHLARNQLNKVTLRRRNAFKKSVSLVHRRRLTGGSIKTYLKKQLRRRVSRRSTTVDDSSPWAVSFTSWTTLPAVTTSDIYPFHAWSILDEDIGNDYFVGECMRLYSLWTWTLTIEELEEDLNDWTEENYGEVEEEEWSNTIDWASVVPFRCRFCEEKLSESSIVFEDDHLEEGMQLFATWTVEEKLVIEDNLKAALVSTKQLLPLPSAGVVRALLCPDVLMASLAALLFETRHLQYINERMALPPPPAWMIDAAVREMDPPNTAVSTVSLPSGWDVLSARVSTSSVFNLFSDVSSPSLFSIDPTGVSSSSSVTGPLAPSSSLSSLCSDPSCPCSSSLSTLFEESLSSSSHHSSLCPDCQRAHVYDSPDSEDEDLYDSPSEESVYGELDEMDSDAVDDEFERSRHTYVVSSAESGYESDADSEPVALEKSATTVSASTQTEAATSQSSTTRMLAECDALMEKIVEMRKKLREMM